ncbi:MAG: hypothetical protein K6G58_09065 [Lachnospiraceae bacterium]|nr:hypothetical protein [Lachnospiraceae bacterium]
MSDLADKFEDAINTVADKAREYGEVARLQALIKAEEAKKQKYYYQLGKKYYELYKDAPASDISEYMTKLLVADEKISDYKEDLKVAASKENAAGAEDAGDPESSDDKAESEDPGDIA